MANSKDIKASKSYSCPMKCEGEKVYEQPGDCPVCNMHLVPFDDQMNSDHGTGYKHVEQSSHENHQHNHSGHSHTNSTGKYYCPMRCEGDKMYEEPGDCPVCGMHLKKEESAAGSKLFIPVPCILKSSKTDPVTVRSAVWIWFLKKEKKQVRKKRPIKKWPKNSGSHWH